MKATAISIMLGLTLGALTTPLAAKADTIRFGMSAEAYQPFSWQDSTGKWQGWEIDLIHAMCSQMKADCEIQSIAWDGIIPALLAKKFDVTCSMSITDERLKIIDFTDKYFYSPNVIIGPKSDTRKFDVAKPETFKGVTIAALRSTTHAKFIQERLASVVDLKLYDTNEDEISDLQAGRVDLMMAAGVQIQDFLKTPEGKGYEIKVTLPHEKMFGYGDGGGVRKEDAALKARINAALKILHENGTYAAITKKYFDIDIYGE